MPDPIAIAIANGLALLVAALGLWLPARWGRRRGDESRWVGTGWVTAVGLGYYLGCGTLGIVPNWPIRAVLDRLLWLVVPSLLLVELMGASARLPKAALWTLRMAVAALAARVLLHGSIYLNGPGPSSWTSSQELLILGAIAAGEASAWIVLARATRRPDAPSMTVSLAVAIGAASITIMLSGYLSGGEAGLPLASALLGGSLATAVLPGTSRSDAPIGIAVVGLGSLLVIGRYFGELRDDHALLLFAAPLLALFPEWPRLRRSSSWVRELVRALPVGIVAFLVAADAARRFVAANGPAVLP